MFSAVPSNHQCCGSGMFIPDPSLCPSRIPDPTTAIEGWGGKIVVLLFLVASNFTKLKVTGFYFWTGKEKSLGKNYSWSWIPDLDVKKAPDPGSCSATLLITVNKKLIHILLFQIRGLSESEMKPFRSKEERKKTRLCFPAILPYYTAARVT
jgi:hypothetical protein